MPHNIAALPLVLIFSGLSAASFVEAFRELAHSRRSALFCALCGAGFFIYAAAVFVLGFTGEAQ